MKALIAIAILTFALTACSSAHHGPGVPSLAGAGAAGAGSSSGEPSPEVSRSGVRPRVGYSATRVGQLHAAAQCVRAHGVPTYQDAVLSADGHVYTDARSIQDVGAKQSHGEQDAMLGAIRQACGNLFTAAGLQTDDESPAPPQVVQAGVRAAQCLRANGLPNMRDPNSETEFTPGPRLRPHGRRVAQQRGARQAGPLRAAGVQRVSVPTRRRDPGLVPEQPRS
jgi:hypothetical protein